MLTRISNNPHRVLPPPSFFNLPRPLSRPRSNTNPTANDPPAPQLAYKQLASAFYTINSKYRISWECAELLIELGSGTAGTTATTAPPTSVSAPAMHSGGSIDGKKSRERAITLAGDEARSKAPTPTPGSSAGMNTDPSPPLASPPSLSWRASTGRHDLSQRQLVLLKEMLNNPDSSFVVEDLKAPIPEEVVGLSVLSVNRDWRWGDAMNSTITLPSEESASGQRGSGAGSPSKKRRRSKLGMSGLRDVLRSLKRSHSDNPPLPPPPIPVSSASLTTDSSVDSQNRPHEYDHPLVPRQGRRRTKTSTGPESMRSNMQRERDLRPTSPYHPSLSVNKASPRRPSLASIFRIGQKSKTAPPTSSLATNGDVSMDSVGDNLQTALGRESSSTGEEEDWDRMDSASDLDAAAKALEVRDGSATVRGIRGRSPYLQEHYLLPGCPSRPTTPKRSASASQSSIWGESSSSTAAPPSRSTRLSKVEESVNDHPGPRLASKGKLTKTGPGPSRPPSRTRKDAKTGSVRSMPPYSFTGSLPDPQLAMTPENIKPLLENAKEVHTRLDECITEIRLLLTVSS
jgi:serine/arginine repetitive matrix protein 2